MLRSGVQSAPRRHKAGTVACGIPARTELASVQRWPNLLLRYLAGFFDGELRERYDDRMGTTINLPDTLVNEVKVRADHEGQSLDDAAADLVRKGLGMAIVPPVPGQPPLLQRPVDRAYTVRYELWRAYRLGLSNDSNSPMTNSRLR
jgi:hypothetical protein